MKLRLRNAQEIDSIIDHYRDAHGVLSEELEADLDGLLEQAKRRAGTVK
jgi:hypothetical protein